LTPSTPGVIIGVQAGRVAKKGNQQMQSVMFQCPAELVEAIDKFAATAKRSRSDIIREALAAVVGFDLASVARPQGRPLKYANPEERKEAQKNRNREKRVAMRDLIEMVRRAERLEDIQLAAILQAK